MRRFAGAYSRKQNVPEGRNEVLRAESYIMLCAAQRHYSPGIADNVPWLNDVGARYSGANVPQAEAEWSV